MTNRPTRIVALVIFVLTLFASTAGPMPAQTAERNVKSPPKGMALVPSGVYKPPFRSAKGSLEIVLKPFYLDLCPVTNDEFLQFVRANPRWRRSQVKPASADQSYLKSWSDDLEFDESLKNAPVTSVSYYAAKAYASWRGKRLPTNAEWEYAAAASATRADGENDAEFQKQILAWHSSPSPKIWPSVGIGQANLWGIHDLHGLVWEWTADFYSGFGDKGLNEEFCGASKNAKDRANYAAYMRFGFRSSLKMDYTVPNLGFRCAKNVEE